MTEIVKVQLPISSSDPAFAELALVYAKNGRHTAQQKLDHATKLAMGADIKAFFAAEFHRPTAQWHIGARVKDEDW